LPSELIAAFLLAQLENGLTITQNRLATWDTYHAAFADLAKEELLSQPVIPVDCQHNAHMYYVILPTADIRNELLEALKDININAIFHYIPLHSSPAGMRYGRVHGRMDNTDSLSGRLLRMPMYNYIDDAKIQRVIESVIPLVKKY
jgi:dTDP-4-amino-4,6-dideoxygalactose transaminase